MQVLTSEMNAVSDIATRVRIAAGTPRFFAVCIAVWAALIMLGGIPYGDLSGYDDAAYAHEARAMIESGDVWTPNLNGNVDFDKPPLFIWMLATSFKIFGATDPAAKLPGVLFGWATILLVYFLTKELFSSEAGEDDANEWIPVLSMFAMATTQYFLKYASHAMTDVPFTFFFTLAIYFYARALKQRPYMLAAGAAVGAALMLRSPMGLFPLAVIFMHLACMRRFRSGYALYFLGASVIALAIPGIWYAREYSVFGQTFIDRHWGNVLAHSGAQIERPEWEKLLSYFEYIFLIVKLYIPWFPFMIYGIYLAVKKAATREVVIEALLGIWILAVILPFSFADAKVLRYILPAFPAFSVFAAVSLAALFSRRHLPKFARLTTLLLGLAAVVMIAMPGFQNRAEDMRVIAPISDAATPAGERVLIYTSGEYGWNYFNQLLWYGHRLSIHARDTKDIDDAIVSAPALTIVTDPASAAQLEARTDLNVARLGASGNFVCIKAAHR